MNIRKAALFSIFTSVATANDAAPRQLWTWKGGDIPGPRPTSPLTPSACSNGGVGEDYAYACPHQAMLTQDMRLAAEFDGVHDTFVYALAGSGTDQECGTCYQVQLLDAERVWRPDFPQLVVQIINSGYDVMPGQLDLFMGGGGFGYFTACNSDCGTHFCQGGKCSRGMYAGDFAAWTQAHFLDPNTCYGGGVKWLNETSPKHLEQMCRALSNNETLYKDLVLQDSCILTNRALFHQNFVSTKYTRVQCPEGLYRLTGIRRKDDADQTFPLPHVDNLLNESCNGSRNEGHYCVTTMQDCCVPSCSWGGKVDTVAGYGRVDRCTRDGLVLS